MRVQYNSLNTSVVCLINCDIVLYEHTEQLANITVGRRNTQPHAIYDRQLNRRVLNSLIALYVILIHSVAYTQPICLSTSLTYLYE